MKRTLRFPMKQWHRLVLFSFLLGPLCAFMPGRSIIRSSSNHHNPIRLSTNLIHHTHQRLHPEIEALMLEYDPILLYASRLLDRTTAGDASALYAWCRRLDEITDNPTSSRNEIRAQLENWQDRFDHLWDGRPVDAMDKALCECLRRHPELGREPFCDMMAGMFADTAETRRIGSMAELEEYGYQVAGTVGLMLLPVLKADIGKARGPSIALGTAIQLINILRDATPDAALGRIYLPQDMLKEQQVQEDDIIALKSSEGYQNVVQKVANRAEQLLAEAEIGKQTLQGFGPLMVQLVIELYRGYLEQLKRLNYNNLLPNRERVRISSGRKAAASIKALIRVLTEK